MDPLAPLPDPPYYAVIFTAQRTQSDADYAETAAQMRALAQAQRGYLGMEAAGDQFEITVSYWSDLDAIATWKRNVDHAAAQRRGRNSWYSDFCVRVCKVERDYGM